MIWKEWASPHWPGAEEGPLGTAKMAALMRLAAVGMALSGQEFPAPGRRQCGRIQEHFFKIRENEHFRDNPLP